MQHYCLLLVCILAEEMKPSPADEVISPTEQPISLEEAATTPSPTASTTTTTTPKPGNFRYIVSVKSVALSRRQKFISQLPSYQALLGPFCMMKARLSNTSSTLPRPISKGKKMEEAQKLAFWIS